VRHEDIPEINNPKIRFPVLEGDKLMKEVLNGGYNVHPVPPPNSEIIERIKKRYETKRIKIEKLIDCITGVLQKREFQKIRSLIGLNFIC